MPLISLKEQNITTLDNRVMIPGETGSGKTGFLLTCDKPNHIISMPGEQGYKTIPLDDPGIFPYIFKQHVEVDDDGNIKQGPAAIQVMMEVKRETIRIITGKYGPVETLCIDGVHKLMTLCLDVASNGMFSSGAKIAEGDIGPMYGAAQKALTDYMKFCIHCQVPNVLFTIWMAPEPDRRKNPGESQSDYRKNVAESLFPDLPGRLARNILGELSATCPIVVRAPMPGQPKERYLLLRPNGEVGGAQIKVPPAYAVTLPDMIPAKWPILASVLAGTYTAPVKAPQGVKPVSLPHVYVSKLPPPASK